MYRVFDATVASDARLSTLPKCPTGKADIHVRLGQDHINDSGYDRLHAWLESDGALILSCAQKFVSGGLSRYILSFPELADFEVSGSTIFCYPRQGCREDTLQHLLLDQVIPRLWAHLGHLVLHAGAVQLPNGNQITFLGETGWGKSTLAGALHERGCHILSDDCISLVANDKGVSVIPSYAGLRLNQDSIATLEMAGKDWSTVSHYSDKRRVAVVPEVSLNSSGLDTLYVMAEPRENQPLCVEAVAGAEVISTVLERSFLLDVRDAKSAATQLQLVAEVIRATPNVCRLSFPRDYQQLSGVCDVLLGDSSP